MAREGVAPVGDSIDVVLLTGQVIKLPSKYLCLYS